MTRLTSSTYSTVILILSILVCHTGYAQNFEWAKKLGPEGGSVTVQITTGSNENIYSTGVFGGTVDFDPGVGVNQLTSISTDGIFISKLDANGSFIWAKQFSGGVNEASNSITLDASENIYVTGRFTGTMDFDPGPSTYNLAATGSPSMFICKLDAAGYFVWAKEIGAGGNMYGKSVAVDNIQNIYLTGYLSNTVDMDPGSGVYNLYGNNSHFLMSLDINGDFRWARQLTPGTQGQPWHTDRPEIVLDASNNVFTTGNFVSTTTFNPSPEAGDGTATSNGGKDVFITKHDMYGNFMWVKGMGGPGDDKSYGITLDAAGSIYTTGTYGGTADFDPSSNVYNLLGVGDGQTFISKLDLHGNFVSAFRFWGLNGEIAPSSISLDASDNIYVSGYFYGTIDFDPGPAPFEVTSIGPSWNGFISKLNAGGALAWIAPFGGPQSGQNQVLALSLGGSGNVYAAGFFLETVDFDPTAGVFNLPYSGTLRDAFILKLSDGSLVDISSEDSGSLNIYPNPSNGVLKIEMEGAYEYRVIDAMGRPVIARKGKGSMTVDISSQPTGIYTLELLTEHGLTSRKLIKE